MLTSRTQRGLLAKPLSGPHPVFPSPPQGPLRPIGGSRRAAAQSLAAAANNTNETTIGIAALAGALLLAAGALFSTRRKTATNAN
ncbi:LPXTG cell wall anchor domain-containing protein [Arthrobacter sp. H41]|uniref:LPXTG cell wall anchor domain-containing protein n=1 Tax=Arthrobacter sp. H41 TaxID=1312978 RepID=UPI0009DD6382